MRTVQQIASDIKRESAPAVFADTGDRVPSAVLYCAAAIVHAVERCESKLSAIEALLAKGRP
jgi:hypothetical protein